MSHAGEDRETSQASTTNKLTSVTDVLLELSLGELFIYLLLLSLYFDFL